MTPSLLECLDVIYRLERDRKRPSPARVAKRLGVDRALATRRIRSLARKGLVRVDGPSRLAVTADGERIAVGLVRKHRLLERFLADVLGLGWERVHEEAGRLTPVVSDDVADAIAGLLKEPPSCPHGNPIPSVDGTLPADAAVPLHHLRPGQSGTIVRIEREEREFLNYLAALGMLPGTRVAVEEVAPFGGPILVSLGDSRYALGRKVAARMFVREGVT
jgi:DtxR family transcriptional regulator, Mn-dependent transcriptional regulator